MNPYILAPNGQMVQNPLFFQQNLSNRPNAPIDPSNLTSSTYIPTLSSYGLRSYTVEKNTVTSVKFDGSDGNAPMNPFKRKSGGRKVVKPLVSRPKRKLSAFGTSLGNQSSVRLSKFNMSSRRSGGRRNCLTFHSRSRSPIGFR